MYICMKSSLINLSKILINPIFLLTRFLPRRKQYVPFTKTNHFKWRRDTVWIKRKVSFKSHVLHIVTTLCNPSESLSAPHQQQMLSTPANGAVPSASNSPATAKHFSSNLTMKQTVYYRKTTKILYNYWYFVMATCFRLSLDHLQANVLK
jgi:hypothetical protein